MLWPRNVRNVARHKAESRREPDEWRRCQPVVKLCHRSKVALHWPIDGKRCPVRRDSDIALLPGRQPQSRRLNEMTSAATRL